MLIKPLNRFWHSSHLKILFLSMVVLFLIVGCSGDDSGNSILGDNSKSDEENNNNSVIEAVSKKTMTIDGDYSDWEISDRIYLDIDGSDCGDVPGQDIQEVYIAQDDTYLYLRFILNGPLDETFGYKFGEDLHVFIGVNNGQGYISYAIPDPGYEIGYELSSIDLPANFVSVNSNQFECKFYKYDVRRWASKSLNAWCDQGTQTVCRDNGSTSSLFSLDFTNVSAVPSDSDDSNDEGSNRSGPSCDVICDSGCNTMNWGISCESGSRTINKDCQNEYMSPSSSTLRTTTCTGTVEYSDSGNVYDYSATYNWDSCTISVNVDGVGSCED